ncbi:MAG: hypothetical protein JNL70_16865 [Saprospiraceae bacterium]|nr:hypothetical protein [Saprospiraceae bacterium]
MTVKHKFIGSLMVLLMVIWLPLKAQDPVKDLQKANQLLNVAQERNRVASEELEDIKSKRIRLEEDLTDLQDNPSKAAKVEKKRVEAEIKTFKTKEDELLQKRRYATNLLVDVTEILSESPSKRAKFISEYEKRYGEIKLGNEANTLPVAQATEAPATASKKKEKTKTKPASPTMTQLESQPSQSTPSNTEGVAQSTKSTKSETKNKKKESASATKTAKKTQTKTEQTEPDMLSAETMPRPKKSSNSKNKNTPKNQTPAPNNEPTKTEETVVPSETTAQQTLAADTITQNETAVKESKNNKSTAQKAKSKKEKKPSTKLIDTPPVTNTETVGDIAATDTPPASTTETNEPKETEKKKKETKKVATKPRSESSKTSIVYKKLDTKDDVLMNTPSMMNCNLAFDGMDNFTGKKKQETTPIVLFTHTDDFMRNAMKDKDYVTCLATATRVEGSRVVYLNLVLTVQSKEAQRTFGFLDRGSYIIFRFINGKKVSLATQKTDIGAVDVDKGTTTFRAQLIIPETIELTQSELDAVRVSWSIGYEDYEIYDMDILRDLFKCLDKTNVKP